VGCNVQGYAVWAFGLFLCLAAPAEAADAVGATPIAASGPVTAAAPATAAAPVNGTPVPEQPATSGFSIDNYVLAAGDKLKISVYGEEGLTGEYIVSSDGRISLPLVGNVRAAGLTVHQFQDSLVKSYEDGFLKDPKITAEVEVARPFFILGEVKSPGQYPCLNGLTVTNAIATAGGFTYRAVTDEVMIRHANQDKEAKVPLTNTTPVFPGDTIRVEERWF
jgi:protein involved in polysaccharide export with SLBB domain